MSQNDSCTVTVGNGRMGFARFIFAFMTVLDKTNRPNGKTMGEKAAAAARADIKPAAMPGIKDLTQVAVITRDAEEMIENIVEALGIGSFKFSAITPPALLCVTYGDGPGDGSMRAGLTWVGDVQLEVIEPLAAPNVYADYLYRRNDRSGVEHIYLQHEGQSYGETIEKFTAAGYPPLQHARINARGRLGFLPVPALPEALAPKLATQFCYTSTQESLKLDIELANFAFGVSQRLGLRMAVPDAWVPPTGRKHFETLPPGSPLRAIDAVYVLGENLEAMTAAYAALTDRTPEITPYTDDMLTGSGRLAEVRLTSTSIFLVEPHEGPFRMMLSENGDGVGVVGAVAKNRKAGALLRERGWAIDERAQGFFAAHEKIPFALWVRPHVR